MKRIRLKNGGKTRHKAFLGADGAIMAAATLAAAGINSAATTSAAKTQAKAVTENAKTQAQSIKQQSDNNTALQKESINFTRQQNQENRQQQQDIQTTLQMMAGQENMNDRMEANKIVVKYGGKTKRSSIKSSTFYGGAGMPFNVTDGGAVLPLRIDNNGFGLYEIIGDTHEQSHKTPNGKRKTGVGIKFKNGDIIEGEGNGNTNQGELMYVTPKDAFFLSKHSIDGYNPTQAVLNGVHPIEAYNVQEILKDIKGLNDDGSTKKTTSNNRFNSYRNSIKKLYGGYNILQNNANITALPLNSTRGVVGGAIYNTKQNNIARYGKKISLRNNIRNKASLGSWLGLNKSDWKNYAGAIYSSVGNVLGAGVNVLGNMYAGNILSDAYTNAGNILIDAYSQMKGISLDEVKREDFEAPHTLAVTRRANTNINPQVERIRRNADVEQREINRGTLSSAARQQRLAATNDRMTQRIGEQYAWKNNQDETIKQGNAERITETAKANADRDVIARKNWGDQRLSLMQYNNNIENAKIAGMAQAKADALTQSQTYRANALSTSMNAVGGALAASGKAFGTAMSDIRTDNINKLKEDREFENVYAGLGDASKIDAALIRAEKGDLSYAKALYAKYEKATDEVGKAHFAALQQWANNNNVNLSN